MKRGLPELLARDCFVVPRRQNWGNWDENARAKFKDFYDAASQQPCAACQHNPAGPLARPVVHTVRHDGEQIPFSIGVGAVCPSCASERTDDALLDLVKSMEEDVDDDMDVFEMAARLASRKPPRSSFDKAAAAVLEAREYCGSEEIVALSHEIADALLQKCARAGVRLREFAEKTSFGVLDKDSVNAVAFKNEGRFYIGINLGLLTRIHRILAIWLSDPTMFQWLGGRARERLIARSTFERWVLRRRDVNSVVSEGPRTKRRQAFFWRSVVHAIRWVWAHEFGHVYGGHLGHMSDDNMTPIIYETPLSAVAPDASRLKLERAKEADADRLAIGITAHNDWHQLEHDGRLGELPSLMNEFMTGASAVTLMFPFSSQAWNSRTSHPHPVVRLHNLYLYVTEGDTRGRAPTVIESELDRAWARVLPEAVRGAVRYGLGQSESVRSWSGEKLHGEFHRASQVAYAAGLRLAMQLRPEMYSESDRQGIADYPEDT